LLPLPPASTLFPYTTLFRSGFFCICRWYDQPFELIFPCLDGNWQGSFDGPNFAVKAQLSHHKEFLQLLRAPDLFRSSQHTNRDRSEEHTSELQSRENLVCRL